MTVTERGTEIRNEVVEYWVSVACRRSDPVWVRVKRSKTRLGENELIDYLAKLKRMKFRVKGDGVVNAIRQARVIREVEVLETIWGNLE